MTVAVILALVSLVVGMLAGEREARHAERTKAVRAGVGRWTWDPGTGQHGFEYGSQP